MRNKESLPHIIGYEFIGIFPNHKEAKCHIAFDDEFSSFYVDGEQGCRYCDLIGWKEMEAGNIYDKGKDDEHK